jgi:hypothetical protein
MSEESNKPNESEEWIMVGAGDPMNFYVGHLRASEDWPAQIAARDLRDPAELRAVTERCIAWGEPLTLVETRLFMTMFQPSPNGGMGMVSQLAPVSGSGGPVILRIKPTIVVFPADTPGMAERISEMSTQVASREMEARAKASGIHLGGTMPPGINRRQ